MTQRLGLFIADSRSLAVCNLGKGAKFVEPMLGECGALHSKSAAVINRARNDAIMYAYTGENGEVENPFEYGTFESDLYAFVCRQALEDNTLTY